MEEEGGKDGGGKRERQRKKEVGGRRGRPRKECVESDTQKKGNVCTKPVIERVRRGGQTPW